MGPSQPPSLQLQQPSLQQALAVAELVRRRSAAATAAAEQRCSELVAEVLRLREAAASPPLPQPPLPPLAQLLAAHSAAAASYSPGAAAVGLDEGDLPAQMESLRLWHQARPLLPPPAEDPALHQALAAAQRFAVLKELAEGPDGGLPAVAALQRTPVAALLELAGDVLQAHAAAEAGSQRGQEGQQGQGAAQQPACLPLSPRAHGPLLAAAVAAAVRLCGWPGQGASDACYASLQRFCSLVLHLASSPPLPLEPASLPPPIGASAGQPSGSGPASAGAAPSQAFPAPAGLPAVDLGQPCCLAAQQVLALLHGSPNAGMVLLSCAAPSTRDCMAALAAAVLGEPQGGGSLGGSSSSSLLCGSCRGSGGGGVFGSGGSAEEARLLAALQLLSQQLSAGLRELPRWVQATGLSDSSFLEDVASAVLAARDAAQLIAVTHPAAARQMQRVAAQMIAALQLLASEGQPHP